ncbi:MAG: energy transducer TonB [Lunatimonas sp.]|uniref:energy transducer TonB n=1 Tax=Lunatimonas sp. TaxID=2060141 RepID=UPI00263AA82E|nr:energy transducer TonB [Lunatimonas sp.]MCC5936151.1 energy transducer TonB [Lunatimonas sp.]
MNDLVKCIGVVLWFGFLGFSRPTHAQERKIIHLDAHFLPTESGEDDHTYSKIVTVSAEGELVEKTYDLNYTLVSVKKSLFEESEPLDPLWEEETHYSSDGVPMYTEFKYRKDNAKYTKVLVDEKLVLDLICDNSLSCEGTFVAPSGEEETVDRDIFKPSLPSVKVWQEFLAKNLSYPQSARNTRTEGEIWIGLKIDEYGEQVERFIVNRASSDPSLVKEVERILDRYTGGFVPARTIYGNPTAAWMYLPIRFRLA